MIRLFSLLAIATAVVALPTDVAPTEQSIRLVTAGLSYLNLKGVLVPTLDPTTNIKTYIFRTSLEEPAAKEDLIPFRCIPLEDVSVTDAQSSSAALICTGDVNAKRVVFLFAVPDLKFAAHEKLVNLVLEKEAVANLNTVPKAYVRSDIDRDRFKRQFGLGFSGSGAQASSSSFGGGGGFGGFPGGFGGGFSGSQASAGASSFGGGGGFFG